MDKNILKEKKRTKHLIITFKIILCNTHFVLVYFFVLIACCKSVENGHYSLQTLCLYFG